MKRVATFLILIFLAGRALAADPTYQADLGVQKTPWGPLHVFDRMRPVHTQPPKYPSEAKRERVTGTLVAVVLIGENGSVQDVKIQVTSGDGRLDKAAVVALKGWRYRVRNPVERCVTLQPMVFSLENE